MPQRWTPKNTHLRPFLCESGRLVTRLDRSVRGRIGQHRGVQRCSQHWPVIRLASRRTVLAAGMLLVLVSFVLVSLTLLPGAGLRVRAQDHSILGRMLREGHSVEARAGAASVIGRRRDEGHRPDLEGALGDQHPTVRAAAASALGRIGSKSSLPPLHGVVRHDRVRGVVAQARAAIDAIEHQLDATSSESTHVVKDSKPRYGLILGEMRNRSRFAATALTDILEHAVERNIAGLPGAAVFGEASLHDAQAAQAQGLSLFRVDGSVTALSTVRRDGQLSMHCEVALLLMDRPSGALRTLLKGAATGVEIPAGAPAVQELSVATRVVDAAVRSALHNADPTIAEAARAH
jgi:hypothetical protein